MQYACQRWNWVRLSWLDCPTGIRNFNLIRGIAIVFKVLTQILDHITECPNSYDFYTCVPCNCIVSVKLSPTTSKQSSCKRTELFLLNVLRTSVVRMDFRIPLGSPTSRKITTGTSSLFFVVCGFIPRWMTRFQSNYHLEPWGRQVRAGQEFQ